MKTKSDYEVVIIGAGVIGLAIARNLAKSTSKSVLVLEKEDYFGKGTSSRNSEVIHSGVYYDSNSLKAKYCLSGRELLYEYCKNNSIWYDRCGKLIIAQEYQKNDILKLYNNGINNGLNRIKLLNSKQIYDLEPNINGDIALYVDYTGIISVHELMHSFYNKSINNHHDYLFKTTVLGSKKISSNYITNIKNSSGENESVSSDWVINCAGLNSDILGKKLIKSNQLPTINFSKGCYFKLSNRYRNKFRHLIYPMPDKKTDTLGIHLTFDQGGDNKLGPNAIELKNRNENYLVGDELTDVFYKEASKYIKDLKPDDIKPDYAGIRPKNSILNNKFSDFYINHEISSGFSKWINLIGIESPGITSCISISDDIVSIINNYNK